MSDKQEKATWKVHLWIALEFTALKSISLESRCLNDRIRSDGTGRMPVNHRRDGDAESKQKLQE